MTRFISILLLIAGAAFAFIYPSYQVAHTGQEVAKFRVFDRETGHWKTGWKPHNVRLTSDMAPLRIRLSGKGLVGANWTGSFLNFTVQLKGVDGIVFSDVLDINIDDTNQIGESRDSKKDIPEILFRVSKEFGVIDNGTYELSVVPQEKFDTSIAYMDAYVVANVEEPARDYLPIAFVLIGVGMALFTIGRRKRKSKKAKHHAVKKVKQRWGRQPKD